MDWQKVLTLLQVIHASAQAGPQYSYWGDRAWAELREMKPAPASAPVSRTLTEGESTKGVKREIVNGVAGPAEKA